MAEGVSASNIRRSTCAISFLGVARGVQKCIRWMVRGIVVVQHRDNKFNSVQRVLINEVLIGM